MTRAKIGRLGYIFSPKNIELMNYLVGFTRDESLPNQNQFMEVVNLYAENEPWQIFEGTNSYPRYFITLQKKKKVQNGKELSELWGRVRGSHKEREKREIKNKGYVICKIKKKGKSTSDENMNDVEELIDSSLQLEDDIIVEEDDVGDEVLAIMDKEDDDGDRNREC
ncbi:hypothetical protein H5410_038479 [Solanum commersonii]|uniref:NAC domain-containing protein n=1 Tax=Solanum commersonii TaxID=4109 RepID=A0A9J5YBG2_SOLCO|nr:hypothetical protein H5410_038479 [Solanum commersonii]